MISGPDALLLLREGLESGSLPPLFSGSYGAESPTLGVLFPEGHAQMLFHFIFVFFSIKSLP